MSIQVSQNLKNVLQEQKNTFHRNKSSFTFSVWALNTYMLITDSCRSSDIIKMKKNRNKMNWTKSEVMPIWSICTESLCTGWPFRWVHCGMVYLGIKLLSIITKMMQANLQPIIQNTESLLLNWKKMNISLLGRVNLMHLN